MIFTCFRFYDFYFFLFTQLPQDLSDIFVYLPIYFLSPIFWRKYYMIFAIPFRMC